MSSRRVGLLFISLLAIALSCSADPPPVHDTDGNELRADANYYVLPANRAHGGGLTMAPGHGRRCPLFVSQEADGQRDGLPVRIAPHGGGAPSDKIIRLSTDVRISFRAYTTCVQSTEWHIDSELVSGRRHVITGPVRDPSPSGRENAFRIEKYSGAEVHEYKLMACGDSCQDLGVFRDLKGGAWFLGATEPYHVVVFKKAPPA
ncbi:endogenous alpha-amylase/subtilisin inhibitor [Aegilops tauschii subsp. strangulata]|uniref:Alpha-amylase/subtilisin inhibitor n=3 Tax=Triticinae TaxID=1648030 RepID=A0A453CGQ6_AEGTS|nr:endogenous alpha-amylase/subtilisin inhibitor [Aegilops tauschii subsp. strangulata]XP_044328463.1 endogenous alpha-amylase/subtilisin inhibitor-like [Triticum aestivum]